MLNFGIVNTPLAVICYTRLYILVIEHENWTIYGLAIFLALFISIFLHMTPTGSAGFAPEHVGRSGASVGDEAQRFERPEAGGLEAERIHGCARAGIPRAVKQGSQEWNFEVLGEQPVMPASRLRISGRKSNHPFCWQTTMTFAVFSEHLASVMREAKTDEEKALAIRELLIGEGFFFRSAPKPPAICRLTSAGYGFCGVH